MVMVLTLSVGVFIQSLKCSRVELPPDRTTEEYGVDSALMDGCGPPTGNQMNAMRAQLQDAFRCVVSQPVFDRAVAKGPFITGKK